MSVASLREGSRANAVLEGKVAKAVLYPLVTIASIMIVLALPLFFLLSLADR